jgi:glycosyltransferase involved in cell wall biosynthesis
MDRPRIAVFTPVYPPMKGGSATYFSTLCRMLSGRADITVICLEGEGPDGEHGIRVLRVLPDRRSGSLLSRLLSVPMAAFKSLEAMRKDGPFVIHAHSNGLYGLSASIYSRLYSIPMIKEVQDTSDRPFVLRSGKVHRWIATGRFVHDRLVSSGVDADRIITFPSVNPPETSEIADTLPPKEEHDSVRIVFVGWLMNRIKGVDVLVKAFSEARKLRPDLELSIVGDGPDAPALKVMSKGLDISFLGEIPYGEVLAQMRSSDILVLPSHEEANPRVIIEAFALGTPVIASDVGGVKEQVLDGESGVLVPHGDVEKLRDAILRLAGDPDLRERLSEGGRRYLDGLPSWTEISEKVLSEYLLAYPDEGR